MIPLHFRLLACAPLVMIGLDSGSDYLEAVGVTFPDPTHLEAQISAPPAEVLKSLGEVLKLSADQARGSGKGEVVVLTGGVGELIMQLPPIDESRRLEIVFEVEEHGRGSLLLAHAVARTDDRYVKGRIEKGFDEWGGAAFYEVSGALSAHFGP